MYLKSALFWEIADVQSVGNLEGDSQSAGECALSIRHWKEGLGLKLPEKRHAEVALLTLRQRKTSKIYCIGNWAVRVSNGSFSPSAPLLSRLFLSCCWGYCGVHVVSNENERIDVK
tara:strand:- start:252 stop:599 length:348 start_codon:yes stop_codon:yes gene_type:complete